MKVVKRALGILLILASIVGILYICYWLFFFKAIADIVKAIMAGWVAMEIIIALCKIFVAFPIVYIAFLAMGLGGLHIIARSID